MIALISPAKTMLSSTETPYKNGTIPRFMVQTDYILSLMLSYSTQELENIFKISTPLAKELRERFLFYLDDEKKPITAIESYDGVVYKHFKGDEPFSETEKSYLQQHLRISSLFYGLLRPLDMIKPYRMEGFVRLSGSDERVDKFWRNIQTKTLIEDVNNSGGALLYLASKEEQNAFNWKEVKKSVRIIDFQFLQYKGDKLRQVIVYTKMARGEMIRYMMKNNISDPTDLKFFVWNGYKFNDTLSTDDVWVWVMS